MGQGYRRPPVLFDGVIDMTFGRLRLLTAFSLVGFPAAIALQTLFDGFVGKLVGNLLSTATIVTMFAVMASRPSQLVATESHELDEYQLSYRYRAMSAAYQALGCLVLSAVTYAYFALEFGGRLPSEVETWQALATGTILYTFVVPTAFLVWIHGYGADEDETHPGVEQA
jgi:hypothetical protein